MPCTFETNVTATDFLSGIYNWSSRLFWQSLCSVSHPKSRKSHRSHLGCRHVAKRSSMSRLLNALAGRTWLTLARRTWFLWTRKMKSMPCWKLAKQGRPVALLTCMSATGSIWSIGLSELTKMAQRPSRLWCFTWCTRSGRYIFLQNAGFAELPIKTLTHAGQEKEQGCFPSVLSGVVKKPLYTCAFAGIGTTTSVGNIYPCLLSGAI